MWQFLIAMLIAILAGTGVGGGGLLILYLTLFSGIEQREAQGVNLLFFLVSALASFAVHLFKRKLNFPLMLTVGILGALGAFLGASLSQVFDSILLQKAFALLLVGSGIPILFARRKNSR